MRINDYFKHIELFKRALNLSKFIKLLHNIVY